VFVKVYQVDGVGLAAARHAFVRARDFAAETVVDRRTGGRPEMVIGHPHHWTFVVADRVASADP
jgi:hypothetical protein